MEDLQYIQGIVPYFTYREISLLNKYSEDFGRLVDYYQAQDLEDLVKLLFLLGSKRFKTKSRKLEYLAVYQSILNHIEILPAEEIASEMMKKMDELKKRDAESVANVYDEIAVTKKKSSIISILNKQFMTEDNGEFLNRHLNLKEKWFFITDRQEETFEWLRENIIESVQEQLDYLHKVFGKDAEITFGSGDEEDDEMYPEYKKEEPLKPSDINTDPMYAKREYDCMYR